MNFQEIAASASPEVQMNENFETIDFASVYGKRQPVTTGLVWGYYGGRWGGSSVAESTFTLTDNATTYVVAHRATGATSAATSTTNWDKTDAYARVYKLTTLSGVVTAVEDHRAGQYGVHGARAPHVNTTPVGNVGAGEDDLMTYSVPADSLNVAKRGLRITVWGTTANNANAKTLKLYFGSAVILTNSLTASIAGVWRMVAEVISKGTDSQEAIAQLVTTGTAGVALNDVEVSTPTQDDGAAITIKCTGDATTTDDIIQRGLLIESF